MWMKYQACYKHGKGSVEWEYLGVNPTESDIEEAFSSMEDEHGDPEGFRRGFYEVVALPPKAYLEALIADQKDSIARLQRYVQSLEEQLKNAV